MKELTAAIDFSHSEISFALMNQSKDVIIERHKLVTGRDSSSIIPWLQECLKEHSIQAITHWNVGMGPGSFTGIRMIAAFVTGATLGRANVKTRGIPSALALASSCKGKSGEKVAVLYDGLRSELLLYGANCLGEFVEGNGEELPFNKDMCDDYLLKYDYYTALTSHKGALEKVLPETILEKVIYHDKFPIAELLNCKKSSWDNNIKDIVYIRPAVFVKPKPIRKDV